MFLAVIQGFITSFSLILAIGSQNAFVLRQGIRREHVAAVVAVCAISDAILIAVGVAGFGAVAAAVPWLVPAMRWFGAAFLLWYGFQRFQAAHQGGEALMPAADRPAPLSKVLLTCVILTWANPHVYLDTMVLIGSISTHHAPFEVAFGWGAAAASLTFFALLGFGARLLAPLFATPRAWVVLECVVGLTMWVIAATLAFGSGPRGQVTKNLSILSSLAGQLIPVEVIHVDHNSLAVAAPYRAVSSPKTRDA